MIPIRTASVALFAGIFSATAFAQSVVSLNSGLVNCTLGAVFLNDKQIQNKYGEFSQLKNGDLLRTELGNAEILLTPGAILRIAEHSSVRMTSNRLSDTRVEFLGGSALIEVADVPKDDHVSFAYQGNAAVFEKNGLYRFDSAPAQFSAYEGQAAVQSAGQIITVKAAHRLLFNSVMTVEKFNNKEGDPLYRWAKRRSAELAVANLSTARSVGGGSGSSFFGGAFGGAGGLLGFNSPGMCNGMMGGGFGMGSGWMLNPYYGSYTLMPCAGTMYSPFGWAYYSPMTVYSVYNNFSAGGYRPSPTYRTTPNGRMNPVGRAMPMAGFSRNYGNFSAQRAASSAAMRGFSQGGFNPASMGSVGGPRSGGFSSASSSSAGGSFSGRSSGGGGGHSSGGGRSGR